MTGRRAPFRVRLINAPALWPLTTIYVGAVAAIIAVKEEVIDVSSAVVGLGMLCLAVLLFTVIKEVRTVHLLVNSQRDDLVARIDQLVTTLTNAGVGVPADPADANDPGTHPKRKSS